MTDKMASIRGCLSALGRDRPKEVEALLGFLKHTKDPRVLVDAWGAVLIEKERARRELLLCEDLEERAAMVLDHLSSLLLSSVGEEIH